MERHRSYSTPQRAVEASEVGGELTCDEATEQNTGHLRPALGSGVVFAVRGAVRD